MYTWGYLKDAILAKLDLEEEEAANMDLLRRFVFYANEVMTQICSSVKPKRTFYEIEIHNGKYNDKNELVEKPNIKTIIKMPADFVSFGDDNNYIIEDAGYGTVIERKICDDDFLYYGYNEIICNKIGKYRISYNARWIVFSIKDYEDNSGQDNDTVLDIPADILDCIPSYVASQCMKIDDEQRAAVLRNEYEVMLARIDDTNFKCNKTFTIGGDW